MIALTMSPTVSAAMFLIALCIAIVAVPRSLSRHFDRSMP